jgi:biotin operon repressor
MSLDLLLEVVVFMRVVWCFFGCVSFLFLCNCWSTSLDLELGGPSGGGSGLSGGIVQTPSSSPRHSGFGPWSEEEDIEFVRLVKAGYLWKDISRQIGISREACASHWHEMEEKGVIIDGVRIGNWTTDETERLRELLLQLGDHSVDKAAKEFNRTKREIVSQIHRLCLNKGVNRKSGPLSGQGKWTLGIASEGEMFKKSMFKILGETTKNVFEPEDWVRLGYTVGHSPSTCKNNLLNMLLNGEI